MGGRYFIWGSFGSHACSVQRVCASVRGWVVRVPPLTQTNTQWGSGEATRNTGASTKTLCRQNLSFVNDRENNHHSFWEQADRKKKEKPKGLLNYSVFVSKEQTPHRD